MVGDTPGRTPPSIGVSEVTAVWYLTDEQQDALRRFLPEEDPGPDGCSLPSQSGLSGPQDEVTCTFEYNAGLSGFANPTTYSSDSYPDVSQGYVDAFEGLGLDQENPVLYVGISNDISVELDGDGTDVVHGAGG